ncbi:MAG: NAD-dependent epimerase/dehydratase family protein [Bacteroidota bacterium]
MIVAVTGANGVVGKVIVDTLNDEKITARPVVRPETDILDMAGLIKAFEGVDAVVHAAGLVSFNPRNKKKLLDVNVQGTRNVVNACLANGTKKLVHISSVSALGKHRADSLVNEDSKWTPGLVASDYAQSKYLAELEVFRGMEEGLKVSVVNPSLVLAAGDGQRSSSHLFGYVWRQRRLYTDFTVNYVDARDVSKIVTRLLREDYNGQRFIASAGRATMKELFQKVAERFQKKAPSVLVPKNFASTAAWLEEFRSRLIGSEPMITRQSVRVLREAVTFENSKAKKILGIEFQSLENTLDWCCDLYKNNLTHNLGKPLK